MFADSHALLFLGGESPSFHQQLLHVLVDFFISLFMSEPHYMYLQTKQIQLCNATISTNFSFHASRTTFMQVLANCFDERDTLFFCQTRPCVKRLHGFQFRYPSMKMLSTTSAGQAQPPTVVPDHRSSCSSPVNSLSITSPDGDSIC